MKEDTVAIVTSTSRGIGRAIALRLAEAGAKVVATSRPSADLDSLAAELGCESIVWPMDVRSEEEASRLFAAVDERYGRVDVLVNNAGIATSGPFMEYTLESWRDVMATNLESVFVLTQEAVRRMMNQGGGHIVNIASDASVRGIPGMVAYCASKHALLGFGRALGAELRGTNIRVTTLQPGPVNTTIGGGAADHWELLQPEDLASTVLYVLSLPSRAEVQELLLEPGPLPR